MQFSRIIGVSTILLLSILNPVFSQDSDRKTPIAVQDLVPEGIEASAASIISERLRSALFSTGTFDVIERNAMSSILAEQGFQASGACSEAECIIEIGQLLGVTQMVAGIAVSPESLYHPANV